MKKAIVTRVHTDGNETRQEGTVLTDLSDAEFKELEHLGLVTEATETPPKAASEPKNKKAAEPANKAKAGK